METPSHETKASLGCGTLILIAIIVAIFSNSGTKEEMKRIDARLQAIEKKLDALLPSPTPNPAPDDSTPVEAEAE